MTKEETISNLKAYLDGDTAIGNIIPLRSVLESAIEYLSEPALPYNLDEAAKEYSKRVSDGHHYRDLQCGFKAGAEWMAGQGVTEEYEVDEDGIYLDSDSLGVCLMAWPPSKLHCKEGDTLIIQMRKRKSGESLKEKEKEIEL